jgi:hypothetical protein
VTVHKQMLERLSVTLDPASPVEVHLAECRALVDALGTEGAPERLAIVNRPGPSGAVLVVAEWPIYEGEL